jgi:murein DD-endopeptidase MepM/ murein hydrolase activator NlpD
MGHGQASRRTPASFGARPRLDSRSFHALVSYKGSPPASVPYARADYERALELDAIARRNGQTAPSPSNRGGRLAWPVVGPVVSPYGMRWGRLHAGIDIAVPGETPIYAAATGRVTTKGWVGGYGNYTCLDHGRQISTCYAHQSRFGPTPSGGVVGRGQLVGTTATCRSAGRTWSRPSRCSSRRGRATCASSW